MTKASFSKRLRRAQRDAQAQREHADRRVVYEEATPAIDRPARNVVAWCVGLAALACAAYIATACTVGLP